MNTLTIAKIKTKSREYIKLYRKKTMFLKYLNNFITGLTTIVLPTIATISSIQEVETITKILIWCSSFLTLTQYTFKLTQKQEKYRDSVKKFTGILKGVSEFSSYGPSEYDTKRCLYYVKQYNALLESLDIKDQDLDEMNISLDNKAYEEWVLSRTV